MKVNSKWITDVKLRVKLSNFQMKNRENIRVIGFGNDFSDITPISQKTKEKINKLVFNKIQKLSASYQESKNITHRMGDRDYKAYL